MAPLRTRREVLNITSVHSHSDPEDQIVIKIRKINGDSRDMGQIKLKVVATNGQEIMIGQNTESPTGISDESVTKKKGDLRITSKFNSNAKSRPLFLVNFDNPRSTKYNLRLGDTPITKVEAIILKDVNLSIGKPYIKELELGFSNRTFILSECNF
jgi:hypothetical protein